MARGIDGRARGRHRRRLDRLPPRPRAGSQVTLLDKSLPGTGATGDSFAWIGNGPEARKPERALRAHVLEDYRRLEGEVPGVHVRWTGSLSWSEHEQTPHENITADRRLVTGDDVAQLEPALRTVPATALLATSDGALDPVALIDALLRAAHEHGATISTGVAAHGLRMRGGQVVGVETSRGFVPAETVVIATGADAPLLCAPLGFDLPVAPSPAVLMRFTAAPDVVRTLVSNDQIEVRQAADGTLLVAWTYDGQTTQDELHGAGQAMLGQLRSSFAGTEAVELVSVRVGMRPMPVDESPVIGQVPGAVGAYLAVMHSGVTLAATVGRLVAAEVLDGVDAEELAALRPSRFSPHDAAGEPRGLARRRGNGAAGR